MNKITTKLQTSYVMAYNLVCPLCTQVIFSKWDRGSTIQANQYTAQEHFTVNATHTVSVQCFEVNQIHI